MPKIFKDKDGRFKVSFKDQNGRTKRRTLPSTNKEDARKLVDDAGIAKLEHAGQAGSLTADVVNTIMAGRKVTCREVLEGWSAWCKKEKASNTANSQELTLHVWFRSLKAYGWPVTRLTLDHINGFVNAPDAGKTTSRNLRLHSIRSFFSYASAHAYCIGNPATLASVRLKDMDVEDKEVTKRVPISKGEYRKIMDSTEGFWRWATALSYWTGLRLVDICCLEWASVKDDAILVYTRKDLDRLWLPFSNEHIGGGDLVPILLEIYMELTDEKYVFPEQRKDILDVAKRAKLSVYYTRTLNRIGIKGKSFHCLRHSFATRLAHAGVNIEEIAVHMGHSSSKLTKDVYAH